MQPQPKSPESQEMPLWDERGVDFIASEHGIFAQDSGKACPILGQAVALHAQACGFRQSGHQVEILHCRSACAFAEIIEHGDQARLTAIG